MDQERSPSSYFCLSELPAFLNWYSFCENSKTSSVLLLLLKFSRGGHKNLSLFSIYCVNSCRLKKWKSFETKCRCVWGNIYSVQERSRQKAGLFVSPLSLLNLRFIHLPLQYSLRARPQWNSSNQSDSALCIYSKIRSDLERLLLENMEQSNSYSRTQNSKHTYEK